MLRWIVVCLLLLCNACAHEYNGVYSRPYLEGEEPDPQRTAFWADRHEVTSVSFANYDVRVRMLNGVQTSEIFWFGIEIPMLPLSWDSERKWRTPQDEGPYCIELKIDTQRSGGSFAPTAAVLEIDGNTHHPVSATHVAYGNQGIPKRAVEPGESVRVQPGRGDIIALCFDLDRPEPDRELLLELGDAFDLPQGERIPTIRFRMEDYRWAI